MNLVPALPAHLFIILLVFTILQRLAELVHSKVNQRALSGAGFTRVDSTRSYIFMVLVHVSWFLAMLLEHFFFYSALPALVQWIALSCFICAQTLRFWALWSLGVHWNVNVMSPTVAVNKQDFIVSGPYQYLRHPNYLAVIIEIFCLPLLGGAFLSALLFSLLNGIVLWYRITEEEELLFARPGYRELMGDRPRLFPLRLRI
jgi:methyltransferase